MLSYSIFMTCGTLFIEHNSYADINTVGTSTTLLPHHICQNFFKFSKLSSLDVLAFCAVTGLLVCVTQAE
jgi:hypothetical protein